MFIARSEYGTLDECSHASGEPDACIALFKYHTPRVTQLTNRPRSRHQVRFVNALVQHRPPCPIMYAHCSHSTFSPEGRLFQVEYSLEAIKLGSTAIGIQTSEGVVLGVEKRVTSTLLETSSVEKIVEIDKHIGCAISGLQADSRTLVEHARYVK